MNTKKNITRICYFIVFIILGLFISFCFFYFSPPIRQNHYYLAPTPYSIQGAFIVWYITLTGLGILWGWVNWNITTETWKIDEKNKFRALFPWALIYPFIITEIVALLITCN